MSVSDKNIPAETRGSYPPHPASKYVEGILRGDRILLSQAITLVESTLPAHQQLAQEIVAKCLPHSGQSQRIGITGSPGAGKSTFIEALGTHLTSRGHRLAVLAVDPSSQVSGGSILGDKTRMSCLSGDSRAYVRPSPAGDALGGVASHTRETILLCEAAGFDTIFIETVGVGQSETTVCEMVDFFLLLLQPAAGDELQGIKRGIVEMADLIAINKADGDLVEQAKTARQEYSRALHLFPRKESGWVPQVITCSALTGDGIEEIRDITGQFFQLTGNNGWLEKNRHQQAKHWMHEHIGRALKGAFFKNAAVRQKLSFYESKVQAGKTSPLAAAKQLLELFWKG
ncbi:MAG: methylmalonyl Co-A mutase-associated GTPase MeaB [Saprospiraceae bacterium]